MARSKSISGGKTGSKEQTSVSNPASVPDAKTGTVETAPSQKAPEVRKLAVVKGESRKNIVPINLEDEIRRRAYELYQQRGSGSGSEAEDWLAAEREVMQRYHQQSA
jgi:hypothetical protein